MSARLACDFQQKISLQCLFCKPGFEATRQQFRGPLSIFSAIVWQGWKAAARYSDVGNVRFSVRGQVLFFNDFNSMFYFFVNCLLFLTYTFHFDSIDLSYSIILVLIILIFLLNWYHINSYFSNFYFEFELSPFCQIKMGHSKYSLPRIIIKVIIMNFYSPVSSWH